MRFVFIRICGIRNRDEEEERVSDRMMLSSALERNHRTLDSERWK